MWHNLMDFIAFVMSHKKRGFSPTERVYPKLACFIHQIIWFVFVFMETIQINFIEEISAPFIHIYFRLYWTANQMSN